MFLADSLSGPFMTSTQITDSSGTPGYPITLRDTEGGDCATRALARLGFTTARKEAA